MTLALKIRYTPGDVEPSPASNTQRVILAWRKARDEYYERQQIREMNEEKFRRRDPETISEFEQVERDRIARDRQRAITEAEEARIDAQQQREAQERMRQQALAAEQSYIRYWTATTSSERTAALIAYGQSIRTCDGYSGSGFATQSAVNRTLASLNDVSNCPVTFLTEYRKIRGIVSGNTGNPTDAMNATQRQRLLGQRARE